MSVFFFMGGNREYGVQKHKPRGCNSPAAYYTGDGRETIALLGRD